MRGIRLRGLIGLVAILLSACSGGDGGPQASQSPQPNSTPSVTASPSALPAPLANGDLAPGTYVFDGFGEPLTVTLGEGWQGFLPGAPDPGQTQLGTFFALFNAEAPAANIAFLVSTRVVDPQKDWNDAGNLVPSPADLVAWFHDHPEHETDESFTTTVGGRDARGVDLVVAHIPKNGWPSCETCVTWIPLAVDHETGPLKADGDLVFAGALGEHDRMIAVDVGGQQLLIDIGASDAKSFRAFLPLAQDVLDSIVIG